MKKLINRGNRGEAGGGEEVGYKIGKWGKKAGK